MAVSENGSKGDRIESFKQELSALQLEKKRMEEREVEQERAKKRKEKEIIEMREELSQLRKLKEEHEEDSVVEVEEDRKERGLDMKL